MRGLKLTIAIASAMVLFVTPAAYAWCGGWGGGWRGGSGPAHWDKLTRDQRQQITSVEAASLKKIATIRAEMAKKRIELMELAAKDNVDEAAIQKTREEMWALGDSMRSERRALNTKIRSLLTPEQRKEIGPFGYGRRGGFGRGAGPGRGSWGGCLGPGRGPCNYL